MPTVLSDEGRQPTKRVRIMAEIRINLVDDKKLHSKKKKMKKKIEAKHTQKGDQHHRPRQGDLSVAESPLGPALSTSLPPLCFPSFVTLSLSSSASFLLSISSLCAVPSVAFNFPSVFISHYKSCFCSAQPLHHPVRAD